MAKKSRTRKALDLTLPIHQFKITLQHIKPPIWRRIQVKDCTLHKLHQHIQTAMGWESCYAYEFTINGMCYSDPDVWHPEFEDSGVASTVRLSECVPENGKRFRFQYEHDFDFSWEHDILFEGCLRVEKGTGYPICRKANGPAHLTMLAASTATTSIWRRSPIQITNTTRSSWNVGGRLIQRRSMPRPPPRG